MGKIIHLDADAFFASVEQSADVRLRGIPMAVGGESRGIIASASYEARKFGVYTPMPSARAKKLCPKLIIIQGDYERYEEFSYRMFNFAYDFTPDVERTSIDEGYFDLTANRTKPASEIAQIISKAIRQKLNITVSQGLGSNKLISQIASKLNKPAAFQTVAEGQEKAFLRPLPNRWLPGIGPKASLRLVALKLSNVYNGVFRTELSFDTGTRNHEARERLAVVLDDLRRCRGRSIIMRGHDIRLREPPRDLVNEKSKPQIKIIFQARRPVFQKIKSYIPLRVRSHFTFLDSTLSPAAIVKLAQRHEMSAIALTDIGNLHGAVEFAQEAKRARIKPIFGTELNINSQPLLLHVQSEKGYHNLNKLLSLHAESNVEEDSVATKQRQSVKLEQLAPFSEGLIAISGNVNIAEMFPGRFYQLLTRKVAKNHFPVVACPEIHYGVADDRLKFDIVQSIRTRTLLRQDHPEKRTTGKLHFRTSAEMFSACRENPEWLENSLEIAERCNFEMPFGKPQFPAFIPPGNTLPREFLWKIVSDGLQRRYGTRAGLMRPQIEQELKIIGAVGYEEYFLVVWNILQDCRKNGIEWITRGSAADSLVCYCLGISDVCPVRFGLYFRRFLNEERMALNKLPDIDIDFPHDRKDDVVKIIFEKYGKEHCAVVGGFSTFQARSAFADVAKVLGVAEREVRRFTNHFPWSFGGGWVPNEPTPSGGAKLREMLAASPENRDLPINEEPFKTALDMAEFLDGVPRNPKMHPCGVVLSRQPIHELTPTFIANKGYSTTHFDMDAVEVLGLVKVDILAQGGLAAMRDVKDSLARRNITVDLKALEPWQDPQVWEMISGGGGRAVHHIESPAMTSLCRQCNVRDIDTLIAIVSVIRPGAANEGKKLAFSRRYQGLEPVMYPHPSLETVLRDTFGLVVYEEHILQICEAFAGLPPGRADVLRRALNKHQRTVIEEIRREFFASSGNCGHSPEKTLEVWGLVVGFAGYAFCKAHSTAYGVEAYESAWLKLNYPAEFMAAVLTNGKGFYDPLVYILESHRLGLKFLPPSVNDPENQFTVSGNNIRVPLIRAKGLTERTIQKLLTEQKRTPFISLSDFYRRVQPQLSEIEIIIRAGGFHEFPQSQTQQFWEAQQLYRTNPHSPNLEFDFDGRIDPVSALFTAQPTLLREPNRRERLEAETELFGFTVSGHLLELFPEIAWETYCPVGELGKHVGETVVTCGLVVEQRTHHQITGEPMKFLTLADWTGMVETELFAQTYKSYGLATVRYPVLEVTATVEPFENGRGFSLRVLRAGKPREIAN